MTATGSDRRIAYMVATGESALAVRRFFEGVDAACKRLLDGYDWAFEWIMTDAGKAIQRGTYSYFEGMGNESERETDPQPTTCSVHLMLNKISSSKAPEKNIPHGKTNHVSKHWL